jgi:hypothetical protein
MRALGDLADEESVESFVPMDKARDTRSTIAAPCSRPVTVAPSVPRLAVLVSGARASSDKSTEASAPGRRHLDSPSWQI